MGLFNSNKNKELELIENITKTIETQDQLIKTLMEAAKNQSEQINSIYDLMIQHAKNTAQHKIIIMNLAKRVGLDKEVLKQYEDLEAKT